MDERVRKMLADMFVEESVRGARCGLVAVREEQKGEGGKAGVFRAMQMASEVQARRILLQLRGGLPEPDEFVREMEEDRRRGFREEFPEVKKEAGKVGDLREAELADRFRRVAANHASFLKKVAEGRSRREELFVCTVCGFIAEKGAPKKCPVCGAVSKRFMAVG